MTKNEFIGGNYINMDVSLLTSGFNALNIGSLSTNHVIVSVNYDTFAIYNFTIDEIYYYRTEGTVSNFKFFIVGDALYLIYSIYETAPYSVIIVLTHAQLTARQTFDHMWIDFFHLDGSIVNINSAAGGLYYDLMNLDLDHLHSDNFPCSENIISANGSYYSTLESIPVELSVMGQRLQYLPCYGHELFLNIPPMFDNQLFIHILGTKYYQNYAGDLFYDGYMSTGMGVSINSKFVKFKFENIYAVSESGGFKADNVIGSIIDENIYYLDVASENKIVINSAFKKLITVIPSEGCLLRIWTPQ